MDSFGGEQLRNRGVIAGQAEGQGRALATIYDVAKVAGVAPSTVSRTFTRPGRVKAETAARVRRVADDLGYRTPDRQTPTASRGSLIGLLVSDLTNPSYSQLIRGAQLAAAELGYEIVLADSRESGARELAALERLAPLVDGFVIASSRVSDAALYTIAKQRPMVLLNRALPGVPGVVLDQQAGARSAVNLLLDLGHEAAAYVAGPVSSRADGVRYGALHEHGMRSGLTITRIGSFSPTFEGGLAAAQVLMRKPPTAVIAYCDLLAIGVMHALLRMGVAVPMQVSVVGFDDIPISRIISPTLTTVAVPMRQMGAIAVKNVVAVINGAKHHSTEPIVIPVQLKVRGSTAEPSRRAVLPLPGAWAAIARRGPAHLPHERA